MISGILRSALAALGWRMLHDFLLSVDLWKDVHWCLNRSSLGGYRPCIEVLPFSFPLLALQFPFHGKDGGHLFHSFIIKEKERLDGAQLAHGTCVVAAGRAT